MVKSHEIPRDLPRLSRAGIRGNTDFPLSCDCLSFLLFTTPTPIFFRTLVTASQNKTYFATRIFFTVKITKFSINTFFLKCTPHMCILSYPDVSQCVHILPFTADTCFPQHIPCIYNKYFFWYISLHHSLHLHMDYLLSWCHLSCLLSLTPTPIFFRTLVNTSQIETYFTTIICLTRRTTKFSTDTVFPSIYLSCPYFEIFKCFPVCTHIAFKAYIYVLHICASAYSTYSQ